MKILMLCDFYGDGQTYQENFLTKYYRKLGHEVVIIASLYESVLDYYSNVYINSKTEKIYFDKVGAKIYKLPYQINILNKLRKFSNVNLILLHEKPDFIFCHGIHLNLTEACNYKKDIKNIPIILDSHADFSNSANNLISKYILNNTFRRLFLRKYSKYISKFYAVVPEGILFMNEMYGIPTKNIELLPLGCDYEYLQEIKNNTKKAILREKLKLNDQDFVIITGGKFNPSKRTEEIINAIKLLSNSNIKLLIFGTADKNYFSYYENLELLANDKNVQLLGWLNSNEIYELMSISDLAVFPASQSVLWQQSIGMGLPVIAGDSGMQDMSYLNLNNNLIKIEPKNINPPFIANLIEELIRNPEKLKSMKLGAEKTGADFLNYKRIAEKTLKF